jgi:hypothetical protein
VLGTGNGEQEHDGGRNGAEHEGNSNVEACHLLNRIGVRCSRSFSFQTPSCDPNFRGGWGPPWSGLRMNRGGSGDPWPRLVEFHGYR